MFEIRGTYLLRSAAMMLASLAVLAAAKRWRRPEALGKADLVLPPQIGSAHNMREHYCVMSPLLDLYPGITGTDWSGRPLTQTAEIPTKLSSASRIAENRIRPAQLLVSLRQCGQYEVAPGFLDGLIVAFMIEDPPWGQRTVI